MSLNRDSKRLLDLGTSLVSTTLGAILISSTSDPIAQILGPNFAPFFNIVLNDFASRKLSKREEAKVGGATIAIIEKLQHNVDNQKTVNETLLQEIDEVNWNSAAELYEAVLIKATNESRTKKLKYKGNIFANCLFTEGMSFDDAHSMIEMLDNINYRKLCLLSFYGRRKDLSGEKEPIFFETLMVESYNLYEIQYDVSLISTLQDLWELGQQNNLINMGNLTPDFKGLEPDRYKLTDSGWAIYRLLDLNEIPVNDIETIVPNLKYKDEYGISTKGTKNGKKVDLKNP